jgi:hypothetical protein
MVAVVIFYILGISRVVETWPRRARVMVAACCGMCGVCGVFLVVLTLERYIPVHTLETLARE